MIPYTVGAQCQQCIVDGFYLLRQGEDRPPVAYVPDRETAERMVRTLNSQQVLIEALQALALDYMLAIGDGTLTESNQPDVLRNARTALQLAGVEP